MNMVLLRGLLLGCVLATAACLEAADGPCGPEVAYRALACGAPALP